MGNGRTSRLLKGIKTISSKAISKFKKFLDKAISGWEYPDNAQEVTQFFHNNSNYDNVIASMTPSEVQFFESWGTGLFMGANKITEFNDLPESMQKALRTYDKVLDKSTLYEGIEVRRLASFSLINNMSRDVPSDLASKIGDNVNLKMPLSASAAAEGLTIGATSKNVEYVFKIPANTTGAGMWIGDTRINSWGPTQREFMINRDTSYKIESINYNNSRKIYEVVLSYIGNTKHEY